VAFQGSDISTMISILVARQKAGFQKGNGPKSCPGFIANNVELRKTLFPQPLQTEMHFQCCAMCEICFDAIMRVGKTCLEVRKVRTRYAREKNIPPIPLFWGPLYLERRRFLFISRRNVGTV